MQQKSYISHNKSRNNTHIFLPKQQLSTAVLSNRIAVDSRGKRWEQGRLFCSRWAQVGGFWKWQCVTNQRQITNATMQQSTVRRRRSTEGRSRNDCTTAQSLAQVGCCFRAVDVIDISWLMCRSILMFFWASREVAVDRASYLLDMRRLKVRRRACHESSWIFYGSSKIRDICAEHLSQGKRIFLCSKTVELWKTIEVSTCI